jgi:phosphatidylserine/phosphatidylglycerophosphate/cardiolipin synthase-like enzyme
MQHRVNPLLITYLIFASSLVCANNSASEITTSAALKSNITIEAAFSPKQGATELIIKNIKTARQSILVAAYSFTSKPIAQELIAAHKRGVKVQIILDKSQLREKHSLLAWLHSNKIPVRINSRYAIMHNKFMIFDSKALQLGSFNYSKAAENKNAENVLVIKDSPETIAKYSVQWEKLWDESQN